MNDSVTATSPPLALSVDELTRSMQASVHGGHNLPDGPIDSLCTDSRALTPGCVFVALRGEHFDGHAFVGKALASGACAAVVDAAGAAALQASAAPLFVVDDTLRALGDVASFVRRRQGGPVVGITGSNGKTTSKELLAAVLGRQGPVHKTAGNLNNLIGLPQTLLRRPPTAWATVLEMGMSQPGEIARLTDIAQPDVGLVTCVAAAHLQSMGSLDNIARAKSELYAHLPKHSVAILNADDALLVTHSLPHLANRQVLRFGTDASCDVQLCGVRSQSLGLQLTLRWRGGPSYSATLPVPGRHNALNAAGAAAAATALGLAPELIMQGLVDVVLPGGRMRLVQGGPLATHIIDDSYNANPGSMQAALQTLVDLAGSHRRLAALGDMLELGPDSIQMHRTLGGQAAALGIDAVFAFGPNAAHTAQAARDGGVQAFVCADFASLRRQVQHALRTEDWLLVKGSRGMRMERLVEAVLQADL